MILRCIDNNLCSSLTLNKEYYVIEETSDYYVVIDDLQNETTFVNHQLLHNWWRLLINILTF